VAAEPAGLAFEIGKHPTTVVRCERKHPTTASTALAGASTAT
jgi:hypothetical protein